MLLYRRPVLMVAAWGTCTRAGRRRAEAEARLQGDRPLRAAARPAPPARPPANRHPPRPRATRRGRRGQGPGSPQLPPAWGDALASQRLAPGPRETYEAIALPSPMPGPRPCSPSLALTPLPSWDLSPGLGLWSSLVWPACKACPPGLCPLRPTGRAGTILRRVAPLPPEPAPQLQMGKLRTPEHECLLSLSQSRCPSERGSQAWGT